MSADPEGLRPQAPLVIARRRDDGRGGLHLFEHPYESQAIQPARVSEVGDHQVKLIPRSNTKRLFASSGLKHTKPWQKTSAKVAHHRLVIDDQGAERAFGRHLPR
jgi:hypothetical protein